jgi:hypothetical protein
MNEEWRAVVGFEGEFEVSNLGRVRRLFSGGADGWRIMKPSAHGSSGQYLVVNLSREGARATGRRHQKGDYIPGSKKYCKVYRLVLEAFVGPCPPGMECRHLDDHGANNRLDNLVWGTKRENADDMIRNGKRKGERNGRAKLTNAQADEVAKRRRKGEALADLSAEFGITKTRVSQLAKEPTMGIDT